MEWTYEGKFVDRSPNIRAAGAPLKKSDTLSDCLKIYPIDDAIETILTEAGLHKVPIKNPPEKIKNTRHVGIYTGAREAINPKVETRYQTLLRDLKETTWDSYWNKELGKTRDAIGALPEKVNNASFAFGEDTKRDEPTGEELVNPPVTPYEIVFNEAEFHRMYKTTHNDYFAGEQVNREYAPPYNKNQRYGRIPQRKANANCSMKWFQDKPVEIVNDILADYDERTQFKLGKPLMPNHNINCVKTGHRFGKKSKRDFHTLADLLQPNRKITLCQKDLYSWLSSLSDARSLFKKRSANFSELLGYCKYADFNASNWLDITTFQRILMDNHLIFSSEDILPLAAHFGIYKDKQVHYAGMLNLFNANVALPDLKPFGDDNTANEFITTAQFERCMAPYKDNSYDCPAGVDMDTSSCLIVDRDNLGNETRASALVNPSILTNYGLSHRDLLTPRKPEYIRKLFERLGYTFPNDTFEKLWSIGKNWDGNEDVCVDTFKQIVEQAAPITINDEPEDECFKNAPQKQCA